MVYLLVKMFVLLCFCGFCGYFPLFFFLFRLRRAARGFALWLVFDVLLLNYYKKRFYVPDCLFLIPWFSTHYNRHQFYLFNQSFSIEN